MALGGKLVTFLLAGLSFFFGIVMLGLSAYMTHVGNDLENNDGYPVDTSRYMTFVSVWVLVFTFVIPLAGMSSARIVSLASLLIGLLTVVFLFAGWVAVAAQAGDWRVYDISFNGNGAATIRGVDNNPYRCAAADAAFGAFEWVTWIIITVIVGMGARSGGKGTV